MIWIDLIGRLAGLVVSGWVWGGLLVYSAQFLGKEPPALLLSIRAEVKPFIPVLAPIELLASLMTTDNLTAKTFAVLGCALALYWYVTDKDDDDRWKRRRQKAADKVKSLGHKLVVAPAQG